MRVEELQNTSLRKIDKISLKGLILAVVLLLCVMVIQVVVFFKKLLPTVKSDLSPIVDSGVVHYTEALMRKMFWGVSLWAMCFIVISGVLIYVLYHAKKYIKHDRNREKSVTDHVLNR